MPKRGGKKTKSLATVNKSAVVQGYGGDGDACVCVCVLACAYVRERARERAFTDRPEGWCY